MMVGSMIVAGVWTGVGFSNLKNFRKNCRSLQKWLRPPLPTTEWSHKDFNRTIATRCDGPFLVALGQDGKKVLQCAMQIFGQRATLRHANSWATGVR